MKRRNVLLACSAGWVAACSTTGEAPADPGAKRREIDAAVDGALADLYAGTKGSRDLAAKAQGILVFPKVVSAGFVVGGSYGQGALRKGGATAGYYSVGAGSVGLLAGAQTKAMYLLFMTPEALQKFESQQRAGPRAATRRWWWSTKEWPGASTPRTCARRSSATCAARRA